jgi:methionyl-tRNA formyltransferase
MKKTSETIVFFGSGPVAAESLRLLAKDFAIEAVVTKPRPEHHRGPVPVLDVAAELNLPVITTSGKKELNTVFANRPVKSRLAVLIDFGIIVSQKVIDYFPFGIINSHFSLLPEWRGADPITFSVLSGQKQTGVSLMLLTAGMDEGPLLAQAPYDMVDDITAPQLTDHLIELSYLSLEHIIPLWFEGAIKAAPQEEVTMSGLTAPTYSRKLTKKDGVLDWDKPAVQLEREIRAFQGWPKSRATFGELEVVIIKAHVQDASGAPGIREIIGKKPLIFCGDKALVLDIVKPAGKKEMTGEAFLAGYKQLFLSKV